MSEQKIFLVEDQASIRGPLRKFLEKAGHLVVLEAKSLDEALEQIPGLVEKGVTIAIVDGNLRPGVIDGNDGQRVTEEIRKMTKKVIVISFATINYDYGDVFFPKERIQELIRYISTLP